MTKKNTVQATLNIRLPMRDGVELATNVYLPANASGPFPVMFVRTPYNTFANGSDVLEWPGRGYAYVVQDTRGRFLSDGEFYPWFNEKNDGEDTLNWIARQPWCNGRVGMYGGSYLAATQLAVSITGHPLLKCLTPCLKGTDFYHTAYSGGAVRLAWQTSWTLKTSPGGDPDAIRKHLPLIDMDHFAGQQEIPYWRDALRHPHFDEFWFPTSVSKHIASIQAPMFIRTGWFDLFVADVFTLFNGLRKQGGNEDVRQFSRIIVGPWPHNINQRIVGEEDFGPDAAIADLYEQEVAYINHFVAQKPEFDSHAAPIRLFIMGINQWRDEQEWPLARTVWTDLFLASAGHANTAAGDGTLANAPAGPADAFDYDPANPVPTKGGAWEFSNVGPHDQAETEKRHDLLVYTSDELPADLEVTGPVTVKLFAASSAPDTDFTAKLVDLRPNGKAMSVTDGIIRARYRHQDGREELLTPGQVYEFTIQCNPTAYVFKKGHRLRLEIASSNFPAFTRNLNTGHDIPTDTEMRIARQSIHHSPQHPSRLILPVIPTP